MYLKAVDDRIYIFITFEHNIFVVLSYRKKSSIFLFKFVSISLTFWIYIYIDNINHREFYVYHSTHLFIVIVY